MSLGSYREWLAERQRLLGGIKELEAENAELKKLLGEDVFARRWYSKES